MGNCGSSRQEKEDINVEKIFCGSYFSRKHFKKKKKKKNKLSKRRTMELNQEKDLEQILFKIENHPKKNEFIELYIKGPPDNEGFMWWNNPPEVFNITKKWVLDAGYDSSGYGIMHRLIQRKIKEKYETPD